MVLAVLMLSASLGAAALKPTKRMADEKDAVVLEKIVPGRFGAWTIDPSVVPVTVSPEVQAKLDVLYNQTLSRTYVNDQGQRIMLSIAYGNDQSGEGTQVHRPEFCYTAQGFQITRNVVGELATGYGVLPVRRLIAVRAQRSEPITYWVTVGENATLPGLDRKLNQLAYGLTGRVPDGMLVRVSSIDTDVQRAYQLQDAFIEEMLAATNHKQRTRIAGTFRN